LRQKAGVKKFKVQKNFFKLASVPSLGGRSKEVQSLKFKVQKNFFKLASVPSLGGRSKKVQS
jgi:hypothetical protein